MPLQSTSGAATYDAFGAPAASAVVQADAIDFDGTNDYLSRASDLIGNADNSTFTFSFWVYPIGGTCEIYQTSASSTRGLRVFLVDTQVQVRIYNSSDTLLGQLTNGAVPLNTFSNVLVSCNTSTGAFTIYVNDILAQSGSPSAGNIDFAGYTPEIGGPRTGVMNGRLSNVFLDYTYRDLSITANRRLFVTADLKPALGQAALNPILYVSMSDPTQPGKNSGTGGDFTLTGTVARSGRGPNQYNAPYSALDGTADYLSRTTALTGIADGKTFTLSFCINPAVVATQRVFSIWDSANIKFYATLLNDGKLVVNGANPAYTANVLTVTTTSALVLGRNYQIVVSVDLTSTSKRHFFVNGSAGSVTWSNYTNDDIDFSTATPITTVSSNYIGSGQFFNGRIGALWFNTSYIDLSVPANLAKFVTGTGIDAKPVNLGASGELPTGTAPLIYLPMYGNNAGKNYGTGGDFTVNSGPYTGARGPNEFWGNKANFAGGANNLQRSSALTGAVDTKTISCSFWISPGAVSGGEYALYMDDGAGSLRGFIVTWSNTNMRIQSYNSSGTKIFEAYVDSPSWGGGVEWNVQLSFDLTNSAKRSLYVNGTQASVTWSPYTNQNIALTTSSNVKFAGGSGNNSNTVRLSEFYLTTDYIDFTQEANRLKFRDCFGNPTDLPSAITALSVPNPAIYMRFPPTSFGTNSGTGGNFTVNGTITDGGQL